MAQTAKYASRAATYGNVAYDLDSLKRNFDMAIYAEPEEEYQPVRVRERVKHPKSETKARVRAQTAAMPKIGISFFVASGFAMAAVLLVFVVLSYVQIAEINDMKSTLRTELTRLDVEAEQLRVEYETTFNINEIEDYAVRTLGMVRLTEDSTSIVSSGRADMGVVLSEGEQNNGEFSGLIDFLGSLLEYFK